MRKRQHGKRCRYQCPNIRVISLVVLILPCCFASSVYAQQNANVSQSAFSGGAVTVGAARFPEPNVTGNMVGGYGYHSFNRLLVGGEGAGVFGKLASGGFGIFTVGYAAWMRGGMLVYPFWGFGGGHFTVNERGSDTTSLFGFGMVVDIISTANSRGFTVGARIGYLFNFNVNDLNTFYLAVSVGRGHRS